MKITRVEAIHLRLPDVNERCDGSQETLVVKVHTDAGIVGVGEVDSSSLVAKAIIEAPLSHKICRGLAECVLGQDPFEIDRLIHRMYEGIDLLRPAGGGHPGDERHRDRPVGHRRQGDEAAGLPAAGRRLPQEVPRLCLDPVRRHAGGDGARSAGSWSSQGYRAVKFGWGPMGQSEESDIAHVRAARQGPRARTSS